MSRVRPRPRRAASDAGFGLLETVVAMMILSVVAMAVLSMLATAQKTAFGNRSRVVAANLAASEMDSLRVQAKDGLSALPIGVGRSTTQTVAGTSYDVRSEVEYVNLADPDLVCGTPVGVQKLNSVRVNVAVTWANMGGVQPVTSDSMISPAFQDAAATTGTIVVRVVDRAGNPLKDATVQAGSKTAISSVEGCAILVEMPPGDTTVTVSRSGFISEERTASDVELITVVKGAASNVESRLDRPAQLTLRSPADASTFPVPSTTTPLLLRLYNGEAPGGGSTTPRAGALNATTETVVSNLFPYSGGYQVFSGPCATAAAGGATTAVTEPGKSATVVVPFAQLEITGRRPNNTAFNGRMYATLTSRAVDGCSAPVVYQRGTQSSPGSASFLNLGVTRSYLRSSLPTGTYDITLSYERNLNDWRSVPLTGVVVDAGASAKQTIEVVVP